MASIRAIIKPALLTWARETMHLSIEAAAKKVGVSSEKLQEWERGKSAPTVPQLRKASEAYKRPLAVFFLAEPPKKFDALRDHRRLPDTAIGTESPDLSLAIRLARSQREVLVEIAEDLKIELPTIEADFRIWRNAPDTFAAEARKLLGVSLESQYSWRKPYEALNNWLRALENLGVLVFQTSDVKLAEMRGFALYEKILPAIVANAKDSPRGRVFTLLHEFAHILLRQSPLCDLHEDRDPASKDQRIEVFCNQVAGNILVPYQALEGALKGLRLGATKPSEDEIKTLSGQFSVSREVVVRRLLTMGRVSLAFYQSKRDQYLRAHQQETQQGGGFAPPAALRVRDLGKLYVQTVVSAYQQEAITAADLSNYLGLKLKHLPRVEQIVFKAD